MYLITANRMLPYIYLFLVSWKWSFVGEAGVDAWCIVVLVISFMLASDISIIVVMSFLDDTSTVPEVSFHLFDDTFLFAVWFFWWLAIFTQHFSHLWAQWGSSESIWLKDRNNNQDCCQYLPSRNAGFISD